MTPLMYPFSFYFDVSSTAYIVMIAANLFVGVVGTIATFILEYFEDSDAVSEITCSILCCTNGWQNEIYYVLRIFE